jgi:hypothetical protein
LLRKAIDKEMDIRRLKPEFSCNKAADIKRYEIVMKYLVKPQDRDRERYRQPRDMWTRKEDSFIEQAMEGGAKPREVLDVYQRRFPDLSSGKTAEVLRSRYRVLMNAKDRLPEGSTEDTPTGEQDQQSDAKEPKHRGPLRIFGQCHLEFLLKLIKDEVLDRLETDSYRKASAREKYVCTRLLSVFPSIIVNTPVPIPEESCAEESAESTESQDEVVERPRRRLPHNAYSPEQNSWLLSKIAIPAQRYSWTRIRAEFQATFPGTIRTGSQLRERSATLKRRAANLQPPLVAAAASDSSRDLPIRRMEMKRRNIVAGSALAAIDAEGTRRSKREKQQD